MGTSLTSLHIFSNSAPEDCGFSFRSFSPNWQTCVNDLSGQFPNDSRKNAKHVSQCTDAPVLYFEVFDSESVWVEFFHKGKAVKKLFDIPALIGYGAGQKRRLSQILQCSDADLKIGMLEEYLGVCLLYTPELESEPELLRRERDDTLYKRYQENEKALTGKAAPFKIDLIAEYPGKIFWNQFGDHTTYKPHFFLYGYESEESLYTPCELTTVRFTGIALEECPRDEFEQGRIRLQFTSPYFTMDYKGQCKVTFSNECPHAFRGKTMSLPDGFYPWAFLQSGELLLQGDKRLYVVDETLKVVSKLSIKGDVADVLGNYILVTAGDSFCGYCYEPKAKIYVYEVTRKRQNDVPDSNHP